MLTLWGCTVKEETCNAIGKFAVLWSQFEIVYFKNNYNVKSYERIEVIKSSSEIDDLISGIKDTLNSYARETYNVGFTWEEKLCIRKNERNYLETVNSFLNERLVQLDAQIKICIFICGRIRNNLLHGFKDIASLDRQKEIFQILEKFLKYIIENNIIDVNME